MPRRGELRVASYKKHAAMHALHVHSTISILGEKSPPRQLRLQPERRALDR